MGTGKPIKRNALKDIARMFKENLPVSEIAKKTGYADRTIENKILLLKKMGVIEDIIRPIDKQNKRKFNCKTAKEQRDYVKARRAEAEAMGLVYCDSVAAKKCLYGSSANFESQGLCNYILLVGHSRGCSPECCSKFKAAESAKQKQRFQRQAYKNRGNVQRGKCSY